jgi:hypothetical protein
VRRDGVPAPDLGNVHTVEVPAHEVAAHVRRMSRVEAERNLRAAIADVPTLIAIVVLEEIRAAADRLLRDLSEDRANGIGTEPDGSDRPHDAPPDEG